MYVVKGEPVSSLDCAAGRWRSEGFPPCRSIDTYLTQYPLTSEHECALHRPPGMQATCTAAALMPAGCAYAWCRAIKSRFTELLLPSQRLQSAQPPLTTVWPCRCSWAPRAEIQSSLLQAASYSAIAAAVNAAAGAAGATALRSVSCGSCWRRAACCCPDCCRCACCHAGKRPTASSMGTATARPPNSAGTTSGPMSCAGKGNARKADASASGVSHPMRLGLAKTRAPGSERGR